MYEFGNQPEDYFKTEKTLKTKTPFALLEFWFEECQRFETYSRQGSTVFL